MSEQAPPALQLRGVHVEYGLKPVLQGLDLSVRPAELCTMVGEHGIGKTTPLDVAGGLLRSDHGSAHIIQHDKLAVDVMDGTPVELPS